MTEEKIVKGQTVLIKGRKIIKIGSSDKIEVPKKSKIIDGKGAFLMPGLADMHMHTRDNWLNKDWPVSPLSLFLANGVTTIRDFGPIGKSQTYALRWREEISKGNLDGPTIYASGKILYESPVNDPSSLVQWNHSQGFDFQKIYSYVSKEDFHKAMTKAKELKFYTAGHIPYPVGLDGVLSEGMDEIAHIEELGFEFVDFDRNMTLPAKKWLPFVIGNVLKQYDISKGFEEKDFQLNYGKTLSDIIRKVKSAKIPICTTLSVGYVIIQKLFDHELFKSRSENCYLPKQYMDAFLEGREKHQRQFKGIEDLATFKYELEKIMLKELHRAGVILLLATDCGSGAMGIVPGFSIHDELRILIENGFTPYEAIATGTINAAMVIEKMAGEGNFGTIEVGKRADLILVNGNPLEDVGKIRDLRGVMAAGKWFERTELEEMIALTR